MRKSILVIASILVCRLAAPVWGIDSKTTEIPRAFLPKTESKITIGKQGEISLWSNKSTLEEILERIAVEKKVTLNFYCQDPGLKQDRSDNLTISADSMEKGLRDLLGNEYSFVRLDREGKPAEDPKDARSLNIYPKGCALADRPARIFLGEREHPVLRKLPEEISIEELAEILKRGGPVFRRRAADVLGMKGDEKGFGYALQALKDENPAVMLAGANALKRLAQKYEPATAAAAIYSRFLEKPYADFLPIIAEVGKETLWPIVDRLLDGSGDTDIGTIVRSLIITKDRRAVPYLAKISAASLDHAKQASYGIASIGGPDAAAALLTLIRQSEVTRRIWAAQAVFFLPKTDGSEVRAEVERMVTQDKVPDSLLQGLAEISYLDPFQKLLKNPDSSPELKIRALSALSAKGTEKAMDTIAVALADESPRVRLASVESMGSMAVDASIPYLTEAYEDKDPQVRVAAVKGLSEFSVRDTIVSTLARAVQDTDANVRRAAVNGLELLGKPDDAMVAVLNGCNGSKDPYVVNKAESILKYWGLKK
jgi:HEAT repeat protein